MNPEQWSNAMNDPSFQEPPVEPVKGKKYQVLDHGHIMLLDSMGNDDAILQAARTSYQQGTKSVSDDRTLLRFLLRHEHASPFESVVLKFHVKLPIFVERQWARHRTAGWNEVSARYSVLPSEVYRPEPDAVRAQSKTNKQGRDGELPAVAVEAFLEGVKEVSSIAYNEYAESLIDGVARELARIVLPLGTYTEKVWWCNLRNIFNFLKLRMDSHAQYEIRAFANAMAEIVRQVVPTAYEAFEDYVLNATSFSRMEMTVLKRALNLHGHKFMEDPPIVPECMTKREWSEFLEKLA